MTSQAVTRLGLTLALFLAGAARPGAAQSPPSGSVTVTEAQNEKVVSVPPGGTLIVRLVANRTTGYSWTAQNVYAKILQPIGKPVYEPPAPGRVGVPGHQVFQFRAVGAKGAKTSLNLQYARPFEKGKPPAKRYTVTVNVGSAAR
jgi:predicted secreted protein